MKTRRYFHIKTEKEEAEPISGRKSHIFKKLKEALECLGISKEFKMTYQGGVKQVETVNNGAEVAMAPW